MEENPQKHHKPVLRVVPISPYVKLHIESLSDRLLDVLEDYVAQEKKLGRTVTIAELIGTVVLVIDILKDGDYD